MAAQRADARERYRRHLVRLGIVAAALAGIALTLLAWQGNDDDTTTSIHVDISDQAPTSVPTPTAVPEPPVPEVIGDLSTTVEADSVEADSVDVQDLESPQPESDLSGATQASNVYMVAKPDAGVFNEEINAAVIPVFDEPGGEERMLVYDHPALPGNSRRRFPLVNPGRRTGQPLVLWPIQRINGDEWVLVQAPVFPKRQAVWVRGQDFDFFSTDVRIEIDIAGQGELRVLRGTDELFRTWIVSGRESRPTPLGATMIDQILDGTALTPAYGPFVVTYPIYSEVMGTFGGGAFLKMAVHGTNQPELMGQRVSSGKIRVTNEVVSELVAVEGLLGARVVVFDSTGRSRDQAIAQQEGVPWTQARTTEPDSFLEIGWPIF